MVETKTVASSTIKPEDEHFQSMLQQEQLDEYFATPITKKYSAPHPPDHSDYPLKRFMSFKQWNQLLDYHAQKE